MRAMSIDWRVVAVIVAIGGPLCLMLAAADTREWREEAAAYKARYATARQDFLNECLPRKAIEDCASAWDNSLSLKTIYLDRASGGSK